MTIVQLEAFLALAEERRFTRAARRLGTTQPRLTRLLQALEAELGMRLVVRSPSGVVPTDAGARFLVHAQRAIDAVRMGRASLDELGREPTGAVSLGTLPTVSAYLLPEMIARFHKQYPALRVRLTEGLQEQLEEQVAGGQLDLAILDLPVRRLDLVAQKLWQEGYVLLLPRTHRLAAAEGPVRLVDVVDEPLVLIPNSRGTETLEAIFRTRGREPRVVIEAPNPEAVRRLVERGVGIGFLPSIIARAEGGRFKCIKVREGGSGRQVALLHRGDAYLTAAARALKSEVVSSLVDAGRSPRLS